MSNLGRRLISGAVAGLAGAAAMKAALFLWHSATANEPRQGAFGLDDEADIDSAKIAWRMLGCGELSESTAKTIGVGMHYAYGAATGALYAAVADQQPLLRAGMGMAFGGLLWLVVDELGVTVSGLSDPRSKSFGSHAAALGAHLLFGLVVESTEPRVGYNLAFSKGNSDS